MIIYVLFGYYYRIPALTPLGEKRFGFHERTMQNILCVYVSVEFIYVLYINIYVFILYIIKHINVKAKLVRCGIVSQICFRFYALCQ